MLRYTYNAWLFLCFNFHLSLTGLLSTFSGQYLFPFLTFPMLAVFFIHLIGLYEFIIIFRELCEFWTSSFCHFLPTFITSIPLGPPV